VRIIAIGPGAKPCARRACGRAVADCGHVQPPAPGMKRWLWAGALLALVLPLVVLLLVPFAALQSEPAVVGEAELARDDVARAIALLRTHDPRHARAGHVSTAIVRERDVEVLLSHGARRWLPGTSGRASFEAGVARVHLSTHLSSLPKWGAGASALATPFGRWLNIELVLQQTGGWPALESLRVGRLPVPTWLAEPLAASLLERIGFTREWALVQDVVRRVRFQPERMLLTYAWQGDSMQRVMASLLTPEELERMRPYHDRLVQLAAAERDWQVPMAKLLGPLFALAAERSAAGQDAVAENRAALVVLTLYANGRHLGHLSLAARSWPRARPLRLTLAGRTDFPLHFLVSAALVTESTSPLARALGLYKEIKDARSGSGFSFNDLAANRAGQRFAELALAQPMELQRRLVRTGSPPLADADLMPPVADLPEFLSEPEFRRRFGGVGEPAYEAVIADIEQRVGSLPLLR
jgi:hypothetical protein